MKNYIKVIRPKNWLKNVFVFIPLVFAIELFNADKLVPTVLAFAAFCMISSSVYLFNDICDAKKDTLHPVKKNRPIASGKIGRAPACVFALLLAGGGIALSLLTVNAAMTLIAGGYLVLNLAYTLYLKHVVVFDCFCIAAGFVLRVYAGGMASGSAVSDRLFLTIVSASLFMAFGKRRGELLKIGDEAITRKVLQRYDLDFLKGMVFVCASLAITFYALWAMERGSHMIYTVPLIIFMITRYLLNIHRGDSDETHGDPTSVIFADKPFLVMGVLYAILVVALLYFAGEAV
jgi:4-hydroxybenzoate polyprenyltransferase